MANHEEKSGSGVSEVFLLILGTIVVFTLIVALIGYLFSGPSADEAAEAEVVADRTQVEENIAPEATVEVASADAAAETSEKTGEEIVTASCAMCHGTGMMESPKIGDAGQWEARIAQGFDTLVSHAINGFNNMPPKGGNAALSDKEVARAVAYMANQAGADFKAE